MHHNADPPDLKTSERQGVQIQLELSPVEVLHYRLSAHRNALSPMEMPTIVFLVTALRDRQTDK